MSRKSSSAKLLSGLFVAGGVLGLSQHAKAEDLTSSEVTKPVLTTEANNLVVVSQELPTATTEMAAPESFSAATVTAGISQNSSVATVASETIASSETVNTVVATSETVASSPEASATTERQSQAQVTMISEVSEQNLNGDAFLTDPSTEKAAYTKEDGDIYYSVVVSNPTDQVKTLTVTLTLQEASDVIGQDSVQVTLAAGEVAKVSNLTVASEWLKNNTGYLVNVVVSDQENRVLSSKRVGLSVEADWTVFPRYGIVAGSPTDQNSILVKNLEAYRKELELMKSMNINSYFFYDAYNEATDPFPEGVDSFVQKWNTWSHTQVDTQAVKALVDQVHKSGAVAMLYNMISADSNPKNPALPLAALAYNFYDSFGKKGQPMTYTIGDNPTQVYYDPANPDWQKYIAGVMKSAMDRMGFDGWQGDTIGDNRVTDYAHRHSTDEADSHMMSDSYASFINAMKDLIGEDYYFTINDVNGGNDDKLKDARQDVIYNELWTNGGSVIPGRMQVAYGDLKARIDMVREKTGKSLIVGAYMEEPGIDYTIPGGKATNGAGKDALAGIPLQGDATLLVDATVAAAGGYHMSIAALANANAALNVLQSAYYPTQYLSVAKDTIRKLYNYQQFITAYENLLRGQGVTNSQQAVSTTNTKGELLSTDALGVEGNQVWTFAKTGKGFSTIQMINMMGINAGWHNEEGTADNKTPDAQKNLTVRYSLAGKNAEEAAKIADQVYVTSPDDWSTSGMQKVKAVVEIDQNGQLVLAISVPELTLWNMLYIKEDIQLTPVTPIILKPASKTNTSQPESDQGGSQGHDRLTSVKDNSEFVDQNQSHQETSKDSQSSDKQVVLVSDSKDQGVTDTGTTSESSLTTDSQSTGVSSEDSKESASHSNASQVSVAQDSTSSTSEESQSEVSSSEDSKGSASHSNASQVSVSQDSTNSTSEDSQSDSVETSESVVAINSQSTSDAIVVSELTSEDSTSTSVSSSEDLVSETTSSLSELESTETSLSASLVNSTSSEQSTHQTVTSLTEVSSQSTTAPSSEVDVTSLTSASQQGSQAQSETAVEPVASEVTSEDQLSTTPSSNQSEASSLGVDSSASWTNLASEAINTTVKPLTSLASSETATATSETITQAESLFSTYAQLSETMSSEGVAETVSAKVSEAPVEKLAVSIMTEVNEGRVDASAIRSIVDLIDTITADVDYIVNNSQALVNGASSAGYQGGQELSLETKQAPKKQKDVTERYAGKVAQVAKSHKWGDRAVAILTTIILSGAAALLALRNFLKSKVAK